MSGGQTTVPRPRRFTFGVGVILACVLAVPASDILSYLWVQGRPILDEPIGCAVLSLALLGIVAWFVFRRRFASAVLLVGTSCVLYWLHPCWFSRTWQFDPAAGRHGALLLVFESPLSNRTEVVLYVDGWLSRPTVVGTTSLTARDIEKSNASSEVPSGRICIGDGVEYDILERRRVVD